MLCPGAHPTPWFWLTHREDQGDALAKGHLIISATVGQTSPPRTVIWEAASRAGEWGSGHMPVPSVSPGD